MDALKQFLKEASSLVTILGGAWLAFSLIVAGVSFKDENGAGIRNGLLMAAGAALVTAGGIYVGAASGAGNP